MMSTHNIEDLRDEVDRLSPEILDLLNRRAECVLAIGVIKRDLGMPGRDVWRENALLAQLAAGDAGPFPEESVRVLLKYSFSATVEVHPDPDCALSDAAQQLSLSDFEEFVRNVARGLATTAEAGPSLTERGGRACDSALRVTSTTG